MGDMAHRSNVMELANELNAFIQESWGRRRKKGGMFSSIKKGVSKAAKSVKKAAKKTVKKVKQKAAKVAKAVKSKAKNMAMNMGKGLLLKGVKFGLKKVVEYLKKNKICCMHILQKPFEILFQTLLNKGKDPTSKDPTRKVTDWAIYFREHFGVRISRILSYVVLRARVPGMSEENAKILRDMLMGKFCPGWQELFNLKYRINVFTTKAPCYVKYASEGMCRKAKRLGHTADQKRHCKVVRKTSGGADFPKSSNTQTEGVGHARLGLQGT